MGSRRIALRFRAETLRHLTLSSTAVADCATRRVADCDKSYTSAYNKTCECQR